MRRRGRYDDRVVLAEVVALGRAVVLLLGIFAPIGFIHPAWESGIGSGQAIVTVPPSEFDWTCSLCGFAAILVLAVGVWVRLLPAHHRRH